MKIQILLLLVGLLIISCRKGDSTKSETNDGDSTLVINDDTIGRVDNDNPDMNDNSYAEFSVKRSDNTTIRLRDKRADLTVASLGPANDTLTREMTLLTDEHKGSTATEYKYDDINLIYLTPKGSNDAWLSSVEIKGGEWTTARGIKVGDTVADMQKMYPNASNTLPEDKLSYVYNVDDSRIIFGTTGDKITRIKIEYHLH